MKFYGYYILWEDPLIVSCFANPLETRAALSLSDPADILLHPTWLWTARSIPSLYLSKVSATFKNKKVHFVCSSERERILLGRFGLSSFVSSISTYINEQVFTHIDVTKEYDAIYAAGMFPYKRLELAADVKNLFVQTYGFKKDSSGHFDLASYCPAVSHAKFNREFLAIEDVVKNYNSASTALALSKTEGAMLAFVEYLLCGLPVVSTPCSGGREEFFDSRFVAVVDDTPQAVAQGVVELIQRQIDPGEIREFALSKLKEHRMRYCKYIVEIIRAKGAKVSGEDQVYSRLFDDPDGIIRLRVPCRPPSS